MNVVLEKSYDYMVYLRDQNQALLMGKGDQIQGRYRDWRQSCDFID